MSKNYHTHYLKDYQSPAFKVSKTKLFFNLEPMKTVVVSELLIERITDNQQAPLELDGEDLDLVSLSLDGKPLTEKEYTLSREKLILRDLPDRFVLSIETHLVPEKNLALSGLYQSNGVYCTQCEAHGFRRITYYLDRPDNLSEFFVRIEADQKKYPVLLSNGNLINQGVEGNRHWVEWHDPFLKPSYLFALVAGDLACRSDHFVTVSNRSIDLKIYVEHGKEDRTMHAMTSLKKAMRWDEEKYGREYDLDIFMILAVSDFNMGAMENKGLNIFNDKYILADPRTATDQDFQAIEGVVAHEYFHNWTGNRITCRDWFQLSLKEGLTVFRDQEFSRDMNSRVVNRIEDVARLKQFQFKEDAGPNAHPVQPDQYIEVNNFYTATVYEKGAELIRMLATLVGETGFRQGMDHYFEQFDGQAVTINDFVQSIAQANNIDLTQFMHWYKQIGTPKLTVWTDYDEASQVFSMHFKQTPAKSAEAPPLMIPIQYALLSEKPEDNHLFILDKAEDSLVIKNVVEAPVVSVLREFSAPVLLQFERPLSHWLTLLEKDDDGVNRYEAAQFIYRYFIHSPDELDANTMWQDALRSIFLEGDQDLALKAKLLHFPELFEILNESDRINVSDIAAVHQTVLKKIVHSIENELMQTIGSLALDKTFDASPSGIARRSLRNACLKLLASQKSSFAFEQLKLQFGQASNMTDQLAAFKLLVLYDAGSRQTVINQFYDQWHADHLVLDKWFSVQAMVPDPAHIQAIKALSKHQKFSLKNPNRLRSLISPFIHFNPIGFHQAESYDFIVNLIKTVDQDNPQIAARLASVFDNWRQFSKPHCDLLKESAELILKKPDLSKDTHEILSKALAG